MILALLPFIAIPALCMTLAWLLMLYFETPNNSQQAAIYNRNRAKRVNVKSGKLVATQKKLTPAAKNILKKHPLIARFVSVFDANDCPVSPQNPIDLINRTLYQFRPLDITRVTAIKGKSAEFALSAGISPDSMIFRPASDGGMIAIEIQKNNAEIVSYNDMPLPKKSDNFSFCGGMTMDKRPVFIDLISIRHLLVGGESGGGKTTFVHTLLCSLIQQNTPEKLKLLLIDPKRMEFASYENIAHLSAPIITERSDAVAAIKMARAELDARNKILSSKRCNDIRQLGAAAPARIVIVIDEMSELIEHSADLLPPLKSIARLGRAVGMHLILATQNPSSESINPDIRANMPARIAFRVGSSELSKIILGISPRRGAQHLSGRGHALLLHPDNGLIEMATPLIELSAVKSITGAHTAAPDYLFDIDVVADQIAVEPAPAKIESDYQHALEICRKNSDSGVSRSVLIDAGFKAANAQKIIKLLHERGAIGPPNGNKKRAVILDSDEFVC